MCKISVIIPIFKVEKYLRQCLDSIIHQTFSDIEIICVNDASPDYSLKICEEYSKQDERVRIINKTQNEGLGLARNSGLNVAKGDLISFIDSDDYISLDMYEKMYSFIQKHQLDTCLCDYERFGDDGVCEPSREIKKELLRYNEQVKDFALDMIAPEPSYRSDVKYNFCCWRTLYSNKIIQENNIRFFSEREIASEDLPFNILYFEKAHAVGYIPIVGYHYRFNPTSLSKCFSLNKYNCLLKLIDLTSTLLKQSTFSPEDYEIHLGRNVLFTFRTIIKYFSNVQIEGNRLQLIKMACDDERLKKQLSSYPLNELPVKHRVFAFCMKHQFVLSLFIASRVENMIHKTL